MLGGGGVPPAITNPPGEGGAILPRGEPGRGGSILWGRVPRGGGENGRRLPLDPPACRRIGIAVQSLEEAAPAVGEFIRYSRRIVAELHQ